MFKYLLIGGGSIIAVLAAALWFQTSRIDSLQSDLASAQRSVEALKITLEDEREARRIAQEVNERLRLRAEMYDTLRQSLLRGEVGNAQIDPDLHDLICRLGLCGN